MSTVADARLALLLDHPWLATALLRLPLVEVADAVLVPTLATDGRAIYYEPGFCASLTLAELQFCVAHELMHCLLDHMGRLGTRDAELWNVAVDLVVNRMLEECGFTVPAGALRDGQGLSVGELTAEEVYDRLIQQMSQRLGAERVRKWLSERRASRLADGHADVGGDGAKLSRFRPEDAPSGEELAVIRGRVVQASQGVHRGWERGNGKVELGRSGRSRVPWEQLLASFLTGLQRNDYRWFPPAKRHLWRGLVLPSLAVSGPAHVVVAIDTSGSMSAALLRRILAEIDGLRRSWISQLTVIDCDAEVQNVRLYEAFEPIDFEAFELRGRGGTSFVPVFAWLEERLAGMDGPVPDVLVFFTDGYGEFPEEEPCLPVCWIMPEGDCREVPFGQVIPMDVHG